MTEHEPEPPPKRLPHIGRHHFASCGEYRPTTRDECPACPDRCPSCGAYLNRGH